jgi:hypothetical protein
MTRINCADFLAEMGNLLDDSVVGDLRAHLEAHLAECASCSVLYDSTRKTIRILTDTSAFALSAEQLKPDTDAIMARIRAGKE